MSPAFFHGPCPFRVLSLQDRSEKSSLVRVPLIPVWYL
uniref:Serine/threonine-protein phosphatase n=1 Tax=Rhizophora mucronata TaxID=61149 RepID=A0A2P2K4S0_RHIMU